jgi:hypothetical protein
MKNVDTVDAVEDIPLPSHSNVSSVPEDVTDPPSRPAESKLARDEWMLEPVSSVTVDPSSSKSARRLDIQDESLTNGCGSRLAMDVTSVVELIFSLLWAPKR